jgi:hypothetical protein
VWLILEVLVVGLSPFSWLARIRLFGVMVVGSGPAVTLIFNLIFNLLFAPVVNIVPVVVPPARLMVVKEGWNGSSSLVSL